jgi:Spy/CpxP family protein refolding chaperone
MKVHKFGIIAVAVLGGYLACASVSSAQDTNTTRRAGRRGPMVEQRIERMTKELDLTSDQQTKVKALLEKQTKERREIFSDNSLPREERRDKMRALMQEENKELKSILTSEQFEKWKKLREQMRTRRPGGPGQAGGPAPAPAPEPKGTDK